MTDTAQLRSFLQGIDGRGYPSYKQVQGRRFVFARFVLFIDHVQGDPFAQPSRMRVRVPAEFAGFPWDLFEGRSREVALRDFLARRFADETERASRNRGSGKSGELVSTRPGQQILEQSAIVVQQDFVEARFRVGLPAHGRRVAGREAADMLCEQLPEVVARSLEYASIERREVEAQVRSVEDADSLREQLAEAGLVAFVADGSVLPRRSGVDDRPLERGAVETRAPDGLAVEFRLPNSGVVRGLGIPRGVTLIVGGGFHGKSTLLRALERGVYNHLPGDGRERVVTDAAAVKIRAEDGRNVVRADISPFINRLPGGRTTTEFSTENASGSTSQATNIVEALEAGARVLLLDEDTSATNFMIRDHRMQELIAKENEPITPFIDKVRRLHEDLDVSTVLVMGGSGDYFDVADTVIAMENYTPHDVTTEARAVAEKFQTRRRQEGSARFGTVQSRVIAPRSVCPADGRRAVKIKVFDRGWFVFGKSDVDVSAVEQLVCPGQVRGVAEAMRIAAARFLDGQRSLAEVLDLIERELEQHGLDVLSERPNEPRGDLAEFRRFELTAALNRLRTLQIVAP